jgi:hypothetical protein
VLAGRVAGIMLIVRRHDSCVLDLRG